MAHHHLRNAQMVESGNSASSIGQMRNADRDLTVRGLLPPLEEFLSAFLRHESTKVLVTIEKMKVGPSMPLCRKRYQTALSG